MDNLDNKHNQYNDDPVYYCTNCLSLKIKTIRNLDLDHCDECGSTVINKAHIEEWRALYKQRYGFDYLDKYYGRD